MIRAGHGFLRLFVFLGLTACVRVDVPPIALRKNTHIITRDREGVRVHVRSDVNVPFTVEYSDRRVTPPTWIPLPGAVGIQGNGEMMEFHDRSPEAPHRTYRVQADGIASGGPPGSRLR